MLKTFAAVLLLVLALALKTFAAVLLLVLALALPALAGPPEGVSGKMVFEDVRLGLQHFRQEANSKNRIAWLETLSRLHDVRVAVAMGEAMRDDDGLVVLCAYRLLWRDYVPHQHYQPADVYSWWKHNEADLRRRAKQLPQ